MRYQIRLRRAARPVLGGSGKDALVALARAWRVIVAGLRIGRRSMFGIVVGVVSLHDFFKESHLRSSPAEVQKNPLVNFSDGSHALGPADFATVYNSAPLYDRQGRLVGLYDKFMLYDPELDDGTTPGEGFTWYSRL